jgi:hypothetical protein
MPDPSVNSTKETCREAAKSLDGSEQFQPLQGSDSPQRQPQTCALLTAISHSRQRACPQDATHTNTPTRTHKRMLTHSLTHSLMHVRAPVIVLAVHHGRHHGHVCGSARVQRPLHSHVHGASRKHYCAVPVVTSSHTTPIMAQRKSQQCYLPSQEFECASILACAKTSK